MELSKKNQTNKQTNKKPKPFHKSDKLMELIITYFLI